MFNAIQTAYNQVKTAGTYHQLILKWGITNGELAIIDRQKSVGTRLIASVA